jgi:hypothetical protein
VNDATTMVAKQLRHQLAVGRKRMTWWIPLIFVAGFGFSVLGVVATVTELRNGASLTVGAVVFTLFALMFGWAVFQLMFGPFVKPRIVPYFARQLGEYRGSTMVAFARGRALFLAIDALDQLAMTLGVKPLSTFGFAYDYFEQEVHWHAAADGVKTAEALRDGLTAPLLALPEVKQDLAALASVLRVAADQGVDFSMVLRLFASDGGQALSMEARQGEFW